MNHIIEKKIGDKDVTINVHMGNFLGGKVFARAFWNAVEEQKHNPALLDEAHKFGDKNWRDLCLKMMGAVAVHVLEDHQDYITNDVFLLNIKVKRISMGGGYSRRSDNAIVGISCAYFAGVNLLPDVLMSMRHKTKLDLRQSDLYRILVHELTHHKDRDFIDKSVATSQSMQYRLGTTLFTFIARARQEGVPRYREYLHFKDIELDFNILKDFKNYVSVFLSKTEVVRGWEGVRLLLVASYDLGCLMCYTIALQRWKESVKPQERAAINKIGQDLIHAVKHGKKSKFPNVPLDVNKRVVRELLRTDVNSFLRTYEIALKKMKIPAKFGVMTFTGYKKAMGKCYENYMKITLPLIESQPLQKRIMGKLLRGVGFPLGKLINELL